MTTTAGTDYRPLLDLVGVDTAPEHVTAYLQHLGVDALTDEQLAVKLGIRAGDYPAHQLLAQAFDADGNVRDQAAFDALIAEVTR